MKRVEVLENKLVFDDFFKIEEAIVRYELFNGQMCRPTRRLNFERGDSAAALVWNRDTEKALLTHQFRYPAYEKGPGWLIEVVAGVLDKDEKPEEAVRREIEEEIGFQVKDLTPIGTFYVSPGGSSERISLFYAEVTNRDKISDGGGMAAESEDIQVVEYSLPELWSALDSGQIVDAKTIIALQWFKEKARKN